MKNIYTTKRAKEIIEEKLNEIQKIDVEFLKFIFYKYAKAVSEDNFDLANVYARILGHYDCIASSCQGLNGNVYQSECVTVAYHPMGLLPLYLYLPSKYNLEKLQKTLSEIDITSEYVILEID